MLNHDDFLTQAGVDRVELETWVELGWLAPQGGAAGWHFHAVDVARAQLIRDLRDDLAVNEHGIGVVLDLVEQVHGLRRALRVVLAALDGAPEETRTRILAALERRAPGEDAAG
jgi:chaperone modulatory protein CbpM